MATTITLGKEIDFQKVAEECIGYDTITINSKELYKTPGKATIINAEHAKNIPSFATLWVSSGFFADVAMALSHLQEIDCETAFTNQVDEFPKHTNFYQVTSAEFIRFDPDIKINTLFLQYDTNIHPDSIPGMHLAILEIRAPVTNVIEILKYLKSVDKMILGSGIVKQLHAPVYDRLGVVELEIYIYDDTLVDEIMKATTINKLICRRFFESMMKHSLVSESITEITMDGRYQQELVDMAERNRNSGMIKSARKW